MIDTPEYRAAFERDQRRFKNDPNRCWDCGLVDACRCDGRWGDRSDTRTDREETT